MNAYCVNIFYSKKDAGYIADMQDLAYCSAFGSTPDDGVSELMRAKDAWLTAAAESSKPLLRGIEDEGLLTVRSAY